jgi:hypothetical protein
MCDQQPFQLNDGCGVATITEFRVPQALPRAEPQLMQPVDLREAPAGEPGIGQGLPTPQGKRFP